MSDTVYKIKTERLIARCYEPKDVKLLKQTIDENLSHLGRFLSWVKNEPEEINKKIERIRKKRTDFDTDKEYNFSIFLPAEDKLIGMVKLVPNMIRDTYEIGYWLHKDFLHHGYMTEIVSALTKISFELYNAEKIEIFCDPSNFSSKAIPERLGFTHEATIRKTEKDEQNYHKLSMVWVLFKEDYDKLNIKNKNIQAFNFIDEQIM